MRKMKLRLIVLLLMVAASLSAQAPTMTISGRVFDAAGKPAPETIVSLIPRDRETGLLGSVQRTAQANSQGNFAIMGVQPGSYLLVASLSQESKEYWSEQRIEVVDSNLAGVQLQLHGALNLSGRMKTAGGESLDLQRLSVRLSPEDGNSPDASASVTKDGTFSLTELRRTTYRLQLAGLPDGWYLRSAVLGSQNVLNDGLRLAEGDAEHLLEIAVSLGAGKVQGVVLEPEFHDTVPHAVVKLFPDPVNPHRADLFRTAPTDKDGRFAIKNVVPGRYRVLAVMGKSGENSYDDSLTAAAAGIRLVLSERQSKNLELELFEAHR